MSGHEFGMQSIKYMCISLCNKQQWQCSDSVFNKLVLVVLDIKIITPSSSKLMLYFFQFLVLGACDYRPFTFFRLFWELYFSSIFSIFGKNFLLCAYTFNVHNTHGIKLLIHNCGQHIKTTIHFFLRCSNYSNQRKALFQNISNIKSSLLNQNDLLIVETLLFGMNDLNDEENARITESKINYIITTERFIALFK